MDEAAVDGDGGIVADADEGVGITGGVIDDLDAAQEVVAEEEVALPGGAGAVHAGADDDDDL